MTNAQVLKAFLNKKSGKSLHLTSTGDKLYSYYTCMAQWHSETGFIIINETKYSQTTSKQINPLKRQVKLYLQTPSNLLIGIKDLKETLN